MKGARARPFTTSFRSFRVTRRRVATFEEPVRRLGDRRGFIDLFWKGVLLRRAEERRPGTGPRQGAGPRLFPGLKEHELPRYVLVSDFQTFELSDIEDDTRVRFSLGELPGLVEQFSFILGVQKRTFRDQDPVNIQASEMMGKLHDALKASGYEGPIWSGFLVRLVFCLFADDTGVFRTQGRFLDPDRRAHEPGRQRCRAVDRPGCSRCLNTPVELRQSNSMRTWPSSLT